MSGFKIAELALLVAASGLALLSVPGLFLSRSYLTRTREGFALATALAGLTLGGYIVLLQFFAMTREMSQQSALVGLQVGLAALARGQYAWTYWLFIVGLVASQMLWSERASARAPKALGLAGLCILGLLAAPLARLLLTFR